VQVRNKQTNSTTEARTPHQHRSDQTIRPKNSAAPRPRRCALDDLRQRHQHARLAAAAQPGSLAVQCRHKKTRADTTVLAKSQFNSSFKFQLPPMPHIPVPFSHTQLAKMWEDEEDDFNSHDPEQRAAALRRRQEQREQARQGEEDYLDDHHYVPGGGGKGKGEGKGAAASVSLSPHHEGYDEAAARKQRWDAFKVRVTRDAAAADDCFPPSVCVVWVGA
jgi:hypothetical protein